MDKLNKFTQSLAFIKKNDNSTRRISKNFKFQKNEK
jgi:hypothetical protein